MLQLEPGIILSADEPYAASGSNPYGHNLFDGQQYLFFYKTGMEDKIKNYTPAKIAQIFKDIEQKKTKLILLVVQSSLKNYSCKTPSQQAMMAAVKNV